MKTSKTIFVLLALFYGFLFTCCKDNSEKDLSLLMKKEKNYTAAIKYLFEKHNTDLIVDSSKTIGKNDYREILEKKTVVLDSVVRSVKFNGTEYVMNVEVECDNSQKIFAVLKCDSSLKGKYDRIQKTKLLIAADIERLETVVDELISEETSIDSTVVLSRENIVMYGRCNDFIVTPTIYDFEREKSRG